MRTWIILCGACVATALAACTMSPAVKRENTTMTKAEIAAEGLICRTDRPSDTNIPRTICASETAWADFDERRKRETDELLAIGRSSANFGRFNRD
jgi:hypothetical protein